VAVLQDLVPECCRQHDVPSLDLPPRVVTTSTPKKG